MLPVLLTPSRRPARAAFYLYHSTAAPIRRHSDRHWIGMALAYLDDIRDRVYFCPLTRRPVHLEHSRRLPYNSSPAEKRPKLLSLLDICGL
jgi:hypothetical protein